MKVKFSHKLIISESEVLEILALILSLTNPEEHQDFLELDRYQKIKEMHEDVLSFLSCAPVFRFSILELALLAEERRSVNHFFAEIEKIDEATKLSYLLGSELDLEEANQFLTSERFRNEMMKLLKIPAEYESWIMAPNKIIEKISIVAKEIEKEPFFKKKMTTLKTLGCYEDWNTRFQEGMKYRHPLSYAQELMGKPFWNIADYQIYEFVPIYYISPYRMRLMDGQKMIYIQSLLRTPEREETEEEMVQILKMISDPTRLKILRLLYMKPMYGKQIAEEINLTTATVSYHLESLRKYGFLNMEKQKQIKYFSTNRNQLKVLSANLLKYIKRGE